MRSEPKWAKRLTAPLLCLAILLPAQTAFADTTSLRVVRAPVQLHPPLASAVAAPRLSPFAPTPKPVMSEGAKAGLIGGGIVAAALLVAGGVIIINR